MNKNIVNKIKSIVKKELADESTGHDYWHSERIWKLSKIIQKKEGGDRFVIEIAALLHDLADRKLNKNKKQGIKKVKVILDTLKIKKNYIEKILFIVNHVSFSSKQPKKKTVELKIVQDADRLDALGAIGIARTFAYGGKTGIPIYNPEIKPNLKMDNRAYCKRKSHSINHFYEKLLKLKGLMNTKTGKELAGRRHEFIERYLGEFYKEWEVKI